MNISGLRKKTAVLEVKHGAVDRAAFPFEAGGMHWTNEERFNEWEQLHKDLDEARTHPDAGVYLDLARDLVVHAGRYSMQDPNAPEYVLPEEFLQRLNRGPGDN